MIMVMTTVVTMNAAMPCSRPEGGRITGRSVSHPSGAIVAFRLIGEDDDECLVDRIRAHLVRVFLSREPLLKFAPDFARNCRYRA